MTAVLGADLERVSTYVGRNAEFCGDIVSIDVPNTNTRPNVLSMEGKLRVVIWSNNIDDIEVQPTSLVGKQVCVNGTVKLYKEREQITVRTHNQIRIVPSDSN